MALKRKHWLLLSAGVLLILCGIGGALFFRAEMNKRPHPSPLGGTMQLRENVLHLTDAVLSAAPDWESWQSIVRERSFERAEISGTIRFAGQDLPIRGGEIRPQSAGNWEISLESTLNRSPLLLSGTADPIRKTFTGKYAAALAPAQWGKHPFFGALTLQGIARTRGNVSVSDAKITLQPAAAMPDEGARLFAGPLEVRPGQSGAEGNGKTISLPGGALILPVLHLADPVLTPQNGAFAVTSTVQWLSPMQMAQQIPLSGTISADGKWNFEGKIPHGTIVSDASVIMEIAGGKISGEGNGTSGLLRISGTAALCAGKNGFWQSGTAKFRRDWRFQRNDAPVLQQSAVTFDRWSAEEDGKRVTAEEMEVILDNTTPGETSFRIAAKTLIFPEMTLDQPRLSGTLKEGKDLQGALTLSAASARFTLPGHTFTAGELRAGGKFTGSWRNGSWQMQCKDVAGQRDKIAYLAPEFHAEFAPGLILQRAKLPKAALTFPGGSCDLADAEITADSLRCASAKGDYLGWKFAALALHLKPDLLQWQQGSLTGHGVALQAVAMDTAAGAFSAKAAKPGSWMDSLTAKPVLKNGALTFRGKGISGLFQSGGFFFNGAVTLRDPAETLSGEFTLPAVTLRNPLPLKKLANAGSDWTLAGKLSCSGSFALRNGVPQWNPAWSFEGAASSPLASAEKLLFQLNGKGMLEGVAGAFRSGRILLSDGEIAVDLSGKTPLLKRTSFSLWGGSWHWDPAAQCFHFRNLSPEGLLALPQWQQALSGTFRGEAQLVWKHGLKLQKLEAFSEKTVRWKLGEMEHFRYVPSKGVDPELFGFAAALAKDFSARRTAISLEVLPEGTLLQLRGEGKPVKPVPYVYNGKTLRPAAPEEHGFATTAELDCDYWIPAQKP